MLTNEKIIKQFGRNICRRCINKSYNISLLNTDCYYNFPYPQKCPCCNEMKNIVTGFRLSGYLKSMITKKKIQENK